MPCGSCHLREAAAGGSQNNPGVVAKGVWVEWIRYLLIGWAPHIFLEECPMPRIQVATEHQNPVELHYEDHGQGKPVVLIHGWPLSGRAWEAQVPALVNAGHRVITYDRRGFGQSSQPWSGYDYDTFVNDLDVLMNKLDLRDATLVGFSMGGGEVARYVGTHGTQRVAKAVLAGAVPPYMYKCADNPEGGIDDATIQYLQDGVKKDRLAFLEDFTHNFFGVAGKVLVSEAQCAYARHIAAFASPKGTLDCIEVFSKTDFREDLKKFRLPTLVIHGGADAIVPVEVSGARAHAAVEGSQLLVIEGAPHGFNVSHAEEFNKGLLEFLRG
jgi:non-heme chloroperoxidase